MSEAFWFCPTQRLRRRPFTIAYSLLPIATFAKATVAEGLFTDYSSSAAMALMVSEHWRQMRAQSRKRSPFCDSQISAHSSHMPTQRSARRRAFMDLLLSAWKVPIQIRAHSSTTLVTFLEKEAFTWWRVSRRCSHFIQASKQAWVCMLVTVMPSSLPLFCGWIPLLS